MRSKNSKEELKKAAEDFDWSAADSMTDDQVEAAALADPDAQPAPGEWFERAAARKRAKKTAAE